jgi:hypothetical protein
VLVGDDRCYEEHYEYAAEIKRTVMTARGARRCRLRSCARPCDCERCTPPGAAHLLDGRQLGARVCHLAAPAREFQNYTKRDSDDMEFFADAAVGQLIIPRLACFWDSPACFYKMPGVLSVLALLLPRTIPYFQDAPVRIHDWQVS